LAVTLVVSLLAALPYLAGEYAENERWVFSGAVYDRQDLSVHLATMHLGARGEWAYRFLFTGEPVGEAYVKLFYIWLGHLSRVVGVSPLLTYHLSRWVLGMIACLAIYLLLAQLFKEVSARRMAFLLVVGGSGLGWLQWIGGWVPQADLSPMDFWLIDGYVFFSLLTLPHFALAIALLSGMVITFIHHLRKPGWWKVPLAAGCGVLLQSIQPYAPILGDAAITGALVGSLGKDRSLLWQGLSAWVIIGLAQIPQLAYQLMIFARPEWRQFAEQNITLTPPAGYLLWGYGLFWVPALIGFWYSLRKQDLGGWTAAVWIGVALVLAYVPWNLQRRFLLGLTLPLGVLAAKSYQFVRARWPAPRWGTIAWLWVGLAMVSSLYLSLGGVQYILSRPKAAFDPLMLVQAVDWLGKAASEEDLVCASEPTSRLVAERSGLRVFLGHPIETLDYERKKAQIEDFFAGERPISWVEQVGCQWLIIGPYEAELGATPVSGAAALMERYRQGGVQILEVRR
jgi:hypothetical protein